MNQEREAVVAALREVADLIEPNSDYIENARAVIAALKGAGDE